MRDAFLSDERNGAHPPISVSLKVRKTVSGANPDDRHRYRQAGGEGAGDRQRECSKQICLRAQLVYRHVACSSTRISRKAANGTNAMTVPARARVFKVKSDGARIWLTKG
jgi:hypothetical protein